MKKLLFLFVIFGLGLVAPAGDRVADAAALPGAATKYIAQHFPNETIQRVTVDDDDNRRHDSKYEVVLGNRVELEFNPKGAWLEVDGGAVPLPESVLPAAILEYLKKNYPDQPATKISAERRGYEVKLLNRVELKFNKDGRFLRIDKD
ncbi:PepSY-like domain-containing protein [Termitidicoccus mucosus]|uniref:Putative beta-lactamase-inhibitor-like PepSY-like domain-containing protein n=1 Tax=Termitidicoccus mucosus TaxID=1184151 RepID=A0A178IKE9_9BACT|nr:hypothetical protein AW736_00655 [Opitutaceae bacterium TSB47]